MDGWEFSFERGRDDYRRGRKRPPNPPEDGSVTKPEHVRWYGWMLERAMQIHKAHLVKEFIEG